MIIKVELWLTDNEAGEDPPEQDAFFQHPLAWPGHTWYPYGDFSSCSLCDKPSDWQRDTIQHPNWLSSQMFCGTCASEKLRTLEVDVHIGIQGEEFGYAWQSKIDQDKEEAER